ncbi:acyl-CoA N-acyltransferase [Trichoderma longibrachiatum]
MPVIESTPDFTIRSATSLDEVKDLWWSRMRDLGWNRDELDAETHFTVARRGEDWLLLVPTGSVEPSGMVIGFTYPNKTGWVGFFIMNEEYRGRGWGASLFKAMLDAYRKHDIHMVGLDAVEEQVSTYARRGFVEAARIKLMTRVSVREVPLDYPEKRPKQGYRVVDLQQVDAGTIANLDRAHTGLYRPALWTRDALFSRPDAFGFAILSEASGEMQGLILVRQCEHGHRIGPLIADCKDHASLLLQLAMSNPSISASNGSLIAEAFGPNEHAAKVFSNLGWQSAGLEYHRMWLEGRVPVEQREGGQGSKGMFAVFDAGQG